MKLHHFCLLSDLYSHVAPSDDRDCSQLEVKMWEPNKMSDYKVEQFLVVARSVISSYSNGELYFSSICSRSIGTFARALLDGAKKPQISLRLGAAAASRDITLVSCKICFTNSKP